MSDGESGDRSEALEESDETVPVPPLPSTLANSYGSSKSGFG